MVIDNIRTATNPIHKQLDEWLMPVFQKVKSIDAYASLLKGFYSFFKPVTDKIDKYINREYLPDYDDRRKPSLIINDLTDLMQPADNIVMATVLPDITNTLQAFGSLYVLEGSTLGGVYLSKVLAENININPEKGLSFFYGYGKQSKERWNAFIEYLNAFAAHNENEEDIIYAAVDTFTCFKKHLQQTINI